MNPDMFFRSTYFLDMLRLPDTISEQELETAIVSQIEDFLHEFGAAFTLFARQKRITVDAVDFHLDLLFFHREPRRLIAIDFRDWSA